MQPISIPARREDITAPWLTQLLSQYYAGVEVTAVDVGEFMGHKPNKLRVHLQYNQRGVAANLPHSMIIKGSFPGYASKSDIVDFSNVAEVVSYRDVLCRVDMNSPTAYVAALGEGEKSGVLLLEDLAPRQPRYFSARDTLSHGQAKKFLSLMASFHAKTWNSDEFEDAGIWAPDTAVGHNFSGLYRDYFAMLLVSPTWDDSLNAPRGAALPKSLTEQVRFANAWPKLLQLLEAGSAKTMIHGDEHLGNVFVEADGTVGFIDPFARPDYWVLGYTYFVIVTLDIVDRRLWERELLAHYLAQLTQHGVDAPSFDEAWNLYRAASLYPLLVWLHNSSQWQPEWTNTANAMRAGVAVLDHDAYGILGC